MLNSNYVDLFLLRHGIAEERSFTVDDSTRALTNKGRIKTTKVVKKLKELIPTAKKVKVVKAIIRINNDLGISTSPKRSLPETDKAFP